MAALGPQTTDLKAWLVCEKEGSQGKTEVPKKPCRKVRQGLEGAICLSLFFLRTRQKSSELKVDNHPLRGGG